MDRSGIATPGGWLPVVVADDQYLFRVGLQHVLEGSGGIEVVGQAITGAEAIDLAREMRPRVALVDAGLPVNGGIETAETIVRECTGTEVIVLSTVWQDDQAIQAMRAGAKGYLLKNASPEELTRAIKLAASGGAAIDQSLAPVLLREYHRMMSRSTDDGRTDGALTQREVKLLRLLASGYSNRQIANELDLAESTVKNNLSALFHKVGVRDRTQAVLYALAENLVSRPVSS
jgi:two-component system response regulator DegU